MDPSTALPLRLTPYLRTLLNDLHRITGPIYPVGNLLRDGLTHQPQASEIELLVPHALTVSRQKLMAAGYTKAVMGSKPNTLLLPLKHDENPKTITIATLRHRPNVPATVEEELLHRDFTINAMAYSWPNGPLLDPFHGLKDLKERRLRLVNGATTLKHNPLRALRFARTLLQIEGQADPLDLQLVTQTVMTNVTSEEVRAELDLIFSLPLRQEASQHLVIQLFRAPLGIDILPELAALREVDVCQGCTETTLWQHCLAMMFAIMTPEPQEEVPLLDLRWTALLHEIGQVLAGGSQGSAHLEETSLIATRILDRLQFSRRRARRIMTLINHLDLDLFATDRALRRLIENRVPLEGLLRLLQAKCEVGDPSNSREQQCLQDKYQKALRRCSVLRQALQRLSPHDLAISGGEILDLVRIPPGPWLGRLQEQLVDWVTADPGRNRPELLSQRIREWIAEQMG